MSRKTSEKISDFVNQKILTQNLEDIMGERFGRYSKYIIQDRALPDARDGLKPVQRRILFAMYKLGIFYNKSYKKSARIVGEVIGKYHPHGDTSVYDAMVRLSQDFKMRMPLIDIHGNNGSIDGDPAAAMRYTEARLSLFADYLLQDINKRTVGFVPNFDDEELEPTVLPSKFPNLLVNGATGIAAGYATDIPPHNIDEIINAVVYRINNPNCSLDALMQIVKGPDFPTGGIIQGVEGIHQAYETGRGKIVVKSKTEIVEEHNLNKIVITEIPYDVNKAVLVKKMTDSVEQKGVDGVIDIRDESDRQGLRIVIDLKKEANPELIRNFFFKATDLQINYSFNMVCISNKRPVLMGLIDLIDSYIAHQKEIITNRSNFELSSAKKRLHIVDGLIAMVSILDAVIKTIRSSANKKEAKENIMTKYSFTELQAEAIVMLQLYRLTNTDIFALQREKEELNLKIQELTEILSNEDALFNVIKQELLKCLETLSSPRKTEIVEKIEEVNVDVKELIEKEDVVVLVTKAGYVKRLSMRNFNTDEETRLKENDVILGKFDVNTLNTILLFTNLGNYVFLPVSKIPDTKHKDYGVNVSVLATIADNEFVIFATPITDFEEERYLLFTTKNGLTKRTHIRDLNANRISKALKATKIREDDELVSVDICYGDKGEVVMVTEQGFMTRYDAKEISLFAPASFGVKALEMKNRPDDKVVAGHYVDSKDILVILDQKGVVRKFKPGDITKGKKNHVGRQYVAMPKGKGHNIIDFEIIHKANIDTKLYISGEEMIKELSIDNDCKSLTLKKPNIPEYGIGECKQLLVLRNNDDVFGKKGDN